MKPTCVHIFVLSDFEYAIYIFQSVQDLILKRLSGGKIDDTKRAKRTRVKPITPT